MIKVIHKKNSDKYENVIYIGRGSVLGNPYTSIQNRETLANFVVESRKESIECFKKYILKKIEEKDKEICNMMNRIYSLSLNSDVYISCYCKPKSCHGDVIKEIIELKIKEKTQRADVIQLNIFGKDF